MRLQRQNTPPTRAAIAVIAAMLLAYALPGAIAADGKPPAVGAPTLRGSIAADGLPETNAAPADPVTNLAPAPEDITAALQKTVSNSGVDTVLSASDADSYRRIFAAQDAGQWQSADQLIRSLENPILIGHVMADRYLQSGYKSSYEELKTWLARYADYSEAERIYALALKKKPKKATAPKRPIKAHIRFGDDGPSESSRVPLRASSSERRRVAAIGNKVKSYLASEKPTAARDYLESGPVVSQLTKIEADELRARIAASYFFEHVDAKALDLAHEVAERRRAQIPMADWTAGLAAWRLGKTETAARHFEELAKQPRINGWTRSAAAFWAARAALVSGVPERVSPNLRIAAKEEGTFYGLLALRQLGQKPPIDWSAPQQSDDRLAKALSIGAVRRAVALGQAGQSARADEEMRRGHGAADPALDGALIALCARHQLPASQLHIADASSDPAHFAALYPVPPYEPQGGFTIDPALIYAFMRQESRFKTQAKSWAGAQGLMQIMPNTAVHVARDKSLKGANRARLYDPAYNMKLGQRYIHELMSMVEPRGNLFMLTVAYNGGPGNLRKWLREMAITDDPLLFIESIPSRETRTYVERVLTNLWIYEDRLGAKSASLDMVAAGEWPVYGASAGSQKPPAASALSAGGS